MKIVFICPYFGKLPNYFDLWLESCKYNKEIDWIIITDDKTQYSYPNNVKVIYKEFHEIKNHIQSKFSFEIALNNPYKLCDFKPAYGYIFEEYIKKYDFWGHCDIDCIFGDIKKFITDDLLLEYDKILSLGHMTLYRNKDIVNKRFMLSTGKKLNYKIVYSSPDNYAFDEWNLFGGINDIYKYHNIPYFKDEIYADISCLSYNFILNKYDYNENDYYQDKSKQIFIWDNGKVKRLYLENNIIKEEEYAYVHFQKRYMNVEIKDFTKIDTFVIVPNKFIKEKDIIDINYIKKFSKRKIFYYVYFKQRFKNLNYKFNNILKNICRSVE